MSETTLAAIEDEVRRLHFRRERLRRSVALPRFADLRYAGRLASGRRATIGFAGVAARTRVRLAVSADEAAKFTVVKQSWLEWLGFAFGLNEPFGVRAAGRERALLARAEVRDAIDRLFLSERADSLELRGGELTLFVPFFDTPPHGYGALLHQLDRVARSFDRAPIRVKVLGGERRALSGQHGPRCAYCHGGLSGEEDDLVACECCATVLHADCWQENARCPILGCAGEEPERG